jgi:hypothetical protein
VSGVDVVAGGTGHRHLGVAMDAGLDLLHGAGVATLAEPVHGADRGGQACRVSRVTAGAAGGGFAGCGGA